MPLLDNYSAHTISDEEKSKLPKWIFVFFLPPNVTNKHQPADMGMIFSIKVGYKVTLLDQILSIFDIGGGYLRVYDERKKQKRVLQGVEFFGKPHFVDAMRVMKPIWEYD